MEIENKTRRKFVKNSAALALTSLAYPSWITKEEANNAYQAMGTRVGEISSSTAIVWARITATPERNNKGITIPGRAQNYKIDQLPEPKVPVEELEGACPGIKGFVRLKYGTEESLKNGKVTPWVEVSEKTDFIHKFHLKNLDSFCTYYF
jgi:phosphodiesterase/alkaline phosphatase D-like protein